RGRARRPAAPDRRPALRRPRLRLPQQAQRRDDRAAPPAARRGRELPPRQPQGRRDLHGLRRGQRLRRLAARLPRALAGPGLPPGPGREHARARARQGRERRGRAARPHQQPLRLRARRLPHDQDGRHPDAHQPGRQPRDGQRRRDAAHGDRGGRRREGMDYSGNEMASAPREVGSARLTWSPAVLRDGKAMLEWVRVGRYWMDADNTHRYPGHDLVHLRAEMPVAQRFRLFGRVTNLLDTRYAELASYTAARGEELAPGLGRTFYAGIEYR